MTAQKRLQEWLLVHPTAARAPRRVCRSCSWAEQSSWELKCLSSKGFRSSHQPARATSEGPSNGHTHLGVNNSLRNNRVCFLLPPTGFIAFSSIPELDRKIKMFFALAPITTNSNMKSPLVKVFDLPEGLVKVRPRHTFV